MWNFVCAVIASIGQSIGDDKRTNGIRKLAIDCATAGGRKQRKENATPNWPDRQRMPRRNVQNLRTFGRCEASDFHSHTTFASHTPNRADKRMHNVRIWFSSLGLFIFKFIKYQSIWIELSIKWLFKKKKNEKKRTPSGRETSCQTDLSNSKTKRNEHATNPSTHTISCNCCPLMNTERCPSLRISYAKIFLAACALPSMLV